MKKLKLTKKTLIGYRLFIFCFVYALGIHVIRKNKIKKENKPPKPKWTDEIEYSSNQTERLTKTMYQERFLLFDSNDGDRTIILCSDTQLKCLSDSDGWHFDGTFQTSPELNYEVYIISCMYKGEMFRCAFTFKKKTEKSYKLIMDKLLQKAKQLQLILNP